MSPAQNRAVRRALRAAGVAPDRRAVARFLGGVGA